MPPWRTTGPWAGEVVGRPLPDGVWRLDWLLPPGKDLVTPELLVNRVRETLTGWAADGSTPAYELLDTGVHTVHHRLARRWRVGRVLLAGDAAHLLGALVVVCVEGYASTLAAESLHRLGLRRATDLIGGFQAWRAAGLPVAAAPSQ
ncbi:hypothetical protein SVIOM342S_01999 [Streptomyces violaceorubidus]